MTPLYNQAKHIPMHDPEFCKKSRENAFLQHFEKIKLFLKIATSEFYVIPAFKHFSEKSRKNDSPV